jgi:hypothetical protein
MRIPHFCSWGENLDADIHMDVFHHCWAYLRSFSYQNYKGKLYKKGDMPLRSLK